MDIRDLRDLANARVSQGEPRIEKMLDWEFKRYKLIVQATLAFLQARA